MRLTFLGICHRLRPPPLGCGVAAGFLVLSWLPLHVFAPDSTYVNHVQYFYRESNQIHLGTGTVDNVNSNANTTSLQVMQ